MPENQRKPPRDRRKFISISVISADGTAKTRRFRTIRAAHRYAWELAGKEPPLADPDSVVAYDGSSRVIVSGWHQRFGRDVGLRDLYPGAGTVPPVT